MTRSPEDDFREGVFCMKAIMAVLLLLSASTAAAAQTDSTAADTTAAASSAQAPVASQTDAVKRAVFCTGVTDHEPVGALTTLAAPATSVTFFTEIVGMAGKTVTHRWIFDGKTVAEVPISVGADRWRCYSTKTIHPGQTGEWTVEVVGPDGSVLGKSSFTYTAS